MGSFLYPITLIGPEGEITIEALVDTGATYTWFPRPILERLGVRPIGKERFALADGRVMEYEIGALTARIDGKERPTICIFGDPDTEPLIGVFTLEGFLLGVDPVNKTLVPVTGRLKESGGTGGIAPQRVFDSKSLFDLTGAGHPSCGRVGVSPRTILHPPSPAGRRGNEGVEGIEPIG